MLTLRKANSKFIAERRDDGKLTYSAKFDRYKVKEQRAVATAFGWTTAELLDALDALTGDTNAVARDYPLPVAASELPVPITVRPVRESQGSTFDCITAALSWRPPYSDAVLQWKGRQRLCCLDIDYHAAEPPGLNRMTDWLYSAVEPKPFAWHGSHGGGMHLFYRDGGGFTAEELAALAGMAWLRIDARATVDLVTVARHPLSQRSKDHASAGPLVAMQQTVNTAAFSDALGRSIDRDVVESHLADQGLRVGQSIEHRYCPICPSDTAHGEPVYLGDSGIFCHVCAAKGRSLGSRRAGYVPWATIIPGGVDPLVSQMARLRCHWTHAKLVVCDRLRVAEELGRLCYSAALKLFHATDDPRLPGVFRAGEDLIRLHDRWVSADGLTPWDKNLLPTLRQLPATQYVGESGLATADEGLVSRFSQKLDLTPCGYPPVTVIRGCRVYGQHLPYTDENRVTVVAPSPTVKAAGPQFTPRYVAKDKRLTVAEQRSCVETIFPGINWNYLRLLVAAKGCVEDRCGLPPFLIVDGPSGSAKSSTVVLASAITGDVTTEVVYSHDTTRFRQSIASAIDAGTYVAVNEILKDARRQRQSATQALDPILNLTEDSTSHSMYIGPTRMGKLPVIVLTDVYIPAEVRNDVQLSRRLIHVRQDQRVDWVTPLNKSEVRMIGRFRVHSTHHARVSDCLLSDVIDEFFGVPQSFEEVAAELGFRTLEQSTEYEDPAERLLEFFHLVSAAPEPSGKYATRWHGPGWKVISRMDETELATLWLSLMDDGNFADSRACRERDWSKILDVPDAVSIDIGKAHDNVIAVRFRTGPRNKPTAVNGDILA